MMMYFIIGEYGEVCAKCLKGFNSLTKELRKIGVAAAYLNMLLGQPQTLPLCECSIFIVSTRIFDENVITTKFIGLF